MSEEIISRPGIMFTPGRKLQEARDNMTFARVKEPNETTSDTESPDEI